MPGYSVNWGHKAFVATVNQKEPVYASNSNYNNQDNVARETYSFKPVLRADTDSLIRYNKDSYTRPVDNNKTKIMTQTSQQPSVIKVFYSNDSGNNSNNSKSKEGDEDKNVWAFLGIFFAFFFFPLGLVFSIIGLKSEYKGLAIAGIVVSSLWILAIVTALIVTNGSK